MNDPAQIVTILVGILVPMVFAIFVIWVTRRGREFQRMDRLFSAIERLQTELHKAFASGNELNASDKDEGLT